MIHSVVKNMSQFENYLQNIIISLLLLDCQRPGLMKVLQICFHLMDPYVCEHKFRWCKRGGSILIYIQDQDSYTLKNNLIVFQTDLESIFMA